MFTHRAPVTLKAAAVKAALRTVGVLVGFVLTMWLVTVPQQTVTSGAHERQHHDVTKSAVERLIKRHHCWTSSDRHDPNQIPGHAVVTLPDRAQHYVDAKVGFAIWLDGKPGELHAFCP